MRKLTKIVRSLIPRSAKSYLLRLAHKHSLMTSQAGQDFWVFGEAFNEQTHGFFVDIGAHDGISISNTYILELKYRWSGICIEANPITFKELKNNRRAANLNVCLDRAEGEVTFVLGDVMGGIVDQDTDNNDIDAITENVVKLRTTSLNRVFEERCVPSIVDYLSIDVEGAEERILAEFDFHKYTFRCITIERPTELLRSIFKDNGYILIKEIPALDSFYVHQDFLEEYKRNLFAFYCKKHLTLRWR